jgi:hypothetical protein
MRPFSPWRLERIDFAGNASKEATEGVVVGGEDAGDVFPHEKSGRKSCCTAEGVDVGIEFAEDEGEIAAIVGEGGAESGHGESLARGATAEEFDEHEERIWPFAPAGEIAEVGDVRVVVSEDGAGKGLNFREGQRLPAQRGKGDAGGFDAGADGEELEHGMTIGRTRSEAPREG